MPVNVPDQGVFWKAEAPQVLKVPPPPPAVGNLEDAKAAGKQPKTLREQLAIHREQKSCAACHAHFDPIGLALENFDQTGRWRDKERSGEPIDSKTELLSGEAVAGAADLSRIHGKCRGRSR